MNMYVVDRVCVCECVFENEFAVNSYSSWYESNYSFPTLLIVWLH